MEEQILRFYLKVFSIFIILIFYFFYILIVKEISFKQDYFFVNKNQNFNDIIDLNLEINSLDSFIYKSILRVLLLNGIDIHYGKFSLSEKNNFFNLIFKITKPSNIYEKITIIEGWSKANLSLVLNEKFNTYHELDYDEVLADTYYFSKGSSYDDFKSEINSKFNELKKRYEINELYKIFSFEELLIIGSLLEKEGLDSLDKKKIYSVIINRLNKNMKLQIDATVIYAITKGNWNLDRKLTFKDLKFNHKYNTYQNYGLPPGPISYVGVKTIELIFENYKSNYLFYFFNNLENKHIFSKTYNEHLNKLNEYRSK